MFNDPVELTPQRSSPRPPVHPSSYKGHFLDQWSEMVDTYMCLLGSSPLDFHLTSTDRVHRPYTDDSIYVVQGISTMFWQHQLQILSTSSNIHVPSSLWWYTCTFYPLRLKCDGNKSLQTSLAVSFHSKYTH